MRKLFARVGEKKSKIKLQKICKKSQKIAPPTFERYFYSLQLAATMHPEVHEVRGHDKLSNEPKIEILAARGA